MNQKKQNQNPPPLRVVAWETTRRCKLDCKHCRADAADKEYSRELSTEDAMKMLDNLASFSKPVLILTGGEPMLRKDIYDLAAHADKLGMRVVMAPCGYLINSESVEKIKSSGIKAISISIDGKDAETHDSFRGLPGAFDTAIKAVDYAIAGNLPFQINTTVSKYNVMQLSQIHELAVRKGASTLDFFFLVPTGRGAEQKELELDLETYEKTLEWIYDLELISPISIKTTCAPQYVRVQEDKAPENDVMRGGGCIGGKGFIFISHRGVVQPCGFLNLNCGDLNKENFDLKKIYEESDILNDLRNVERYTGKCGNCRFIKKCGGCRARAFEYGGNYMGSAPECIFEN